MTTHHQTKLRGTAAILLTLTLGLAGCAENAIDTLDSHITASNALSPRDELEIRQLLARMNLAIDTQSWDAYVTFYAEDLSARFRHCRRQPGARRDPRVARGHGAVHLDQAARGVRTLSSTERAIRPRRWRT